MRNLKRITGLLNAPGATCYLCVGAIPRSVYLANLTVATNPIQIKWQKEMMREVLCVGGILIAGAGTATKMLAATGISPYEGGDLMTSANQTTTYGHGIYLGWDEKNYQADYVYGAVAKATPINRWSFDGTLSGHFNSSGVASGCRIGVGSRIRIKEDSTGLVKEAGITAIAATPRFTTASDVTLDRAIGSGAITFISGMYDLAPIDIGRVTPAGIRVADTTCMVHDNLVAFDMTVSE